jgi:hypothetical protein
MKARELRFTPPCTDSQFIQGLIAQIVYSKLGKIKLFEHTSDTYSVVCDCTEVEQIAIQALIEMHMPAIYDQIHRFALDMLYRNNLYHGGKIGPVGNKTARG